MAIVDELEEVNNLPSCDELFEAFTELHNDLKKIRMKNASFKNKNVEFSNENDTLNRKMKCLKVERKKFARRYYIL